MCPSLFLPPFLKGEKKECLLPDVVFVCLCFSLRYRMLLLFYLTPSLPTPILLLYCLCATQETSGPLSHSLFFFCLFGIFPTVSECGKKVFVFVCVGGSGRGERGNTLVRLAQIAWKSSQPLPSPSFSLSFSSRHKGFSFSYPRVWLLGLIHSSVCVKCLSVSFYTLSRYIFLFVPHGGVVSPFLFFSHFPGNLKTCTNSRSDRN